MIRKIAGQHGPQMQVTTLLGRGFIDFRRDGGRHSPQEIGNFRITPFHENRNTCEVHLALLAESLHRIEHPISPGMSCPQLHRQATRCMDPKSFFTAIGQLRNKPRQDFIGQGSHIKTGP